MTMTTTRTPRRYTTRALDDNRALLIDHETGETTEYWAPGGGGYVRAIDNDHPGTLGQQVCDGLSPMSSTLIYREGGRLIHTIRREARVAYRRRADW